MRIVWVTPWPSVKSLDILVFMTQPPRVTQAPAQVNATIAAQIRAHRLKLEWSVRQLADECAKHGAPQLTEASLGNIERGQDPNAKRKPREVTVEEMLILAYVLRAKPAELMFKPSDPAIEVAPGVVVRPYVAWSWLMGWVPTTEEEWGPLVRPAEEITYPNAYYGWNYFDQTYAQVLHAQQDLVAARTAGDQVEKAEEFYSRCLSRFGIALGEAGSAVPIDLPPIPRWLYEDLIEAEKADQIKMTNGSVSNPHPRTDPDGFIRYRIPRRIPLVDRPRPS